MLFTSAIDAINTLAAAKAAGQLKRDLRRYLRPRLLILDELGYRQRRAPRARCRGAAAMNLPNLPYLLAPYELSDEAAAYVSELLNDLAVAFDGQYFAQIRRY